jgi:hypothetical protein
MNLCLTARAKRSQFLVYVSHSKGALHRRYPVNNRGKASRRARKCPKNRDLRKK